MGTKGERRRVFTVRRRALATPFFSTVLGVSHVPNVSCSYEPVRPQLTLFTRPLYIRAFWKKSVVHYSIPLGRSELPLSRTPFFLSPGTQVSLADTAQDGDQRVTYGYR